MEFDQILWVLLILLVAKLALVKTRSTRPICIKTQAVLIFERMFILVQGDGVAGWKIGIDGGPSTPPIVTADTR